MHECQTIPPEIILKAQAEIIVSLIIERNRWRLWTRVWFVIWAVTVLAVIAVAFLR